MIPKKICVLLLVVLAAVNNVFVESKEDPFHYSLSEKELRDVMDFEPNSDYEDEESDTFGGQVHDFFRESNNQMVLDLDIFIQYWKELSKFTDETLDGNVDYLREIIDFLSPLQKDDVSPPCLSDILHFMFTTYNYANTVKLAKDCHDCNCTREFKKQFAEYQWIFDVVDAVGKVPAAITGGNNLWLGSWSTCRKISSVKNTQGQKWQGQYCMTSYYAYNKYNPLKTFGKKVDPSAVCRNNVSSKNFDDWPDEDKTCFDRMALLNVGLCMPDSCTDYDVKKIVEFVYKTVESSIDSKFVCNLTVQCSHDRPESKMYNSVSSMIILSFMLLIFSLIIYGTCYDYYILSPVQQRRVNSEPLEPKFRPEQDSLFVKLLIMFSIKRNVKQIMDTRTDDTMIRCLHGARFMSMCWIIFGHTYYYICTSFTTDNLIQTLRGFPKLFYNQIVVQAPLAVDSFFFLSGLLTTYIFIKKLNNKSVHLDRAETWVAYYVRRYLRLTPVYLIIMLLENTLFTYMSEGPFWRPIERNYCRNNWWVNLLYLNNFLMQDDQCMGWTWYMANDFQLHCVAPILIIALYKFKKWGVAFAGVLMAISVNIGLIITIQKGYPPAPILSSSLDIVAVLDEYWTELYVKPYIRCVPYIVGSVIGYLLNATNRKYEMSTLKQFTLWFIFSFLGIYAVFGLFYYTKYGVISEVWKLMYTLFGRLSFSLFLGWLTFACETGHADKINRILGHKMFIPLSKMTFCAYLLHPLLLQMYYLSRNTAFHFTHSFQMFYMFSVAVFVSYAVAFVFCLAFEMPVTNFDKLLFTPKRRPKLRKKEGIEEDAGYTGIEDVPMDTLMKPEAVPELKPIIKNVGSRRIPPQQPLLSEEHGDK